MTTTFQSEIELHLRASEHQPTVVVEARFDGEQIVSLPCHGNIYVVKHGFDDTNMQDHVLELELTGKTNNDPARNLLLHVERVVLDRVDITAFFNNTALPYHHCNNGHSDDVNEVFSGNMGCDGVVMFCFASPVYAWIKQNFRYYGTRWEKLKP